MKKQDDLIQKIAVSPVYQVKGNTKQRLKHDLPINYELWQKLIPRLRRLGYKVNTRKTFDYKVGVEVVTHFSINDGDGNTFIYEPMLENATKRHGTLNDYYPILERTII